MVCRTSSPCLYCNYFTFIPIGFRRLRPPPPSFKDVTPSSRTHMRQLLVREQCLQREQKLAHHSNKQQQLSSRSFHPMATATIAISNSGSSLSHPEQAASTWQQRHSEQSLLPKATGIALLSYILQLFWPYRSIPDSNIPLDTMYYNERKK